MGGLWRPWAAWILGAGRGQRRRAQGARRPARHAFRRLTVERLEDRSLLAATLLGTVWQDLNSDGQQAGGEPAIQFAVAELFSSTNGTIGDSDDVSLGTRITDAAGNYQFTGLAAGVNHYVVVRPPVGFAFTVQDTGPDATDSDVSATGRSAMFAPADLSTVDLDAGLTGAVPAFGWATQQGGDGYDEGYSVAVDAAGFSYVTGSFSGTVDFDPGPGVYNLTSGGMYLAKYTPGGALNWAWRVGGSSSGVGYGVAVDAAGNVLVTGYFDGTFDFDPGAGVANLTSAGHTDVFVLKLNASGNYLWAARVGDNYDDRSRDVRVDASGDVLVTGYFSSTVDFDPGAGTANLTSVGDRDVFVLKLNGAGAYQWAVRVGGTGFDRGVGVVVDASGNVLVTGTFEGTADFDPGAGVANLASAGGDDVFVLKLDAAGSYLWAGRFGGASNDYAPGVAVNGAGNVIVTGYFEGTADFDPGPGTVNLTSAGLWDMFVLKLNASGNLIWAKRVGGTINDAGHGVAVDAADNVLVAGYFGETVDFDPGAGTVNRGNPYPISVFVLKLDASGNYATVAVAGGAGADKAYGVALDALGNVLVTGTFQYSVDFDPGPGTFNLRIPGGSAGFLARWNSVQFAPEINLVGNGQSIASGDRSPSLQDFTDFGGQTVSSGQVTRTYTIQNTGGMVLNLTGTPAVQITGAHSGDFAVAALPAGSISEWQATTLQIAFDPSAVGLRTATVTIQNDDADEGNYTFAIQGTGLAGFDQATVSGTVWHDLNSDGQQSGGEPGVGYAVVELFDTVDGVAGNGDDVLLGVRVTDANGNYQFAGLSLPGPYHVVVRPPVGFAFAMRDAGGNDVLDSDVSSVGLSSPFTLASGQSLDLDAGLTGAAPAFGWAASQWGTGYDLGGWSVAADAAGNVLVAGSFRDTAEFDPGPGTMNLTSAGDIDVYVAKYTSAGALVWARRIGGTGWDVAYGVAVDSDGDVVVTGYFADTADFDPGAGVANLTSAGGSDAFVLKLNGSGNYVWARRVGGTSSDNGNGVAVDATGSVLVTGSFQGTADFDPGAGTANLTSAGDLDAFVLKLDAAGNYVWAGRVGGTSGDYGSGVAVDAVGNLLVTGSFDGTGDFDPRAGVANLISLGGGDAFVMKLDATGNYLWARGVGGTSNDRGLGVAVDATSNVLVTGVFQGTVDFDPGAGVANLTSAGGSDAFVLKLNGSGNYAWARRVGGTSSDNGNGVAVDATGSVLVTGSFQGTADFDPGAGTANLTSAGDNDVFLLRLNAAGAYQWAWRFGSGWGDYGLGVAVDGAGNVLMTGSFDGTVDFDPGAGTFNLTSAGNRDGFVWRLSASNFLPPQVRGVFVRGTGDASGSGNDEWLAAYLGHLGTQGLGDAALGYRVSVGADQLDTLPWTNVDTVSIRFSEGVTVVSGNLQVLGAAEGPAVPSVANFSYNASTFTATWQFTAPLPANKYLLHFANGAVVGLDTFALDGEWTDGVSTASGDAVAGGAFSFRMNVVPGDVNGDAVLTQSVTNADVLLTKQRFGTDTSDGASYAYRRDVNGSGFITNPDVLLIKQQQSLGTSIFDYSEPVPPPPGESFGEESFAAGTLLDESNTVRHGICALGRGGR